MVINKLKNLDFIFGLSSLLGLIITAVYTVFAILDGNYSLGANSVIIALAFINFALAITFVLIVRRNNQLSVNALTLQPKIDLLEKQLEYSKNRLKRSLYNFEEISDILHSINDQLRDRIVELSEVDIENAIDISVYQRKNEMFYLFLLDNIKNIFDMLTRDECAISLKILDLDEEDNEIIIRTLFRDSSSYRERKNSDKTIYNYPYYENSAFKEILSEDGDSFYVSDDLSSETTYINLNKDWKKYYNATLVCPIRMEIIENEEDEYNDYSILGFICIDNMKGNLNNKTCISLLASITDILYIQWFLYNETKYLIESNKTQEKNICQ
jgi:hypothetical protein